MRAFLERLDIRVSVVYGIVATLWIVFSGTLVGLLFAANPRMTVPFEVVKGLGFVGVTTLALFLILSTELRKRTQVEQALHRTIAERQRAESDLVEERNLLRSVIDILPDNIFVKDKDGRFLLNNPASMKLLGVSRQEEALGKTDFDFFPHDIAAHYAAKIQDLIRSGQPIVDQEEFQPWQSDQWRWQVSTVVPRRDEQGNVTGLVGRTTDITERKQAGEALRQSEERYHVVSELISDFAFCIRVATDASLEAEWVTDSFARVTGFSLSELVKGEGHQLFALSDTDDQARMDAATVKLLRGETVTSEYRIKTKSGEMRWLRLYRQPVWDDVQQRVVRYYGIAQDITERKRGEETLIEQRNLLQTLIDTIPDGIYVKDSQSHFLLANRAHLTGLCVADQAEIVGKTDFDFFPREEAERFFADEQAVLPTGQPLRHREETGTDRLTGRVHWLDATKAPLRDSSGRIIGLVGISYNITPRKQMEEALRQSEARFHAIFERAAIGIALVNKEGYLIESNPALRRLLGYSREELQTLPFTQFTHPEDIATSWALAQEAFAGKHDSYQIEIRYVHKESRLVWGHLTASLVRDTENRPEFIVGMVEDITGRKRAEEALIEERNLLRTLIDNMPDYIYVKDSQSRFLVNNRAQVAALGAASPEETLGKTDFDYYPREQATIYLTAEEAVLQTGQPLLNREEPVIDRSTGRLRWIDTTKAPLRDHSGQISGLVGIGRDITERKQAAEALRQSEAAERAQRILAEALRDTAEALVASLDPAEVMIRILDNVGRVVPHEWADIALIEGDSVRIAYLRGWLPDEEVRLRALRVPLTAASLHTMLTENAPLIIADTRAYAGWMSVIPQIRSCAGAPIHVHGQVIGFLRLMSAEPGFFTASQAERLQAFANQAGIALEHAQLYDQLRLHAHELEQRVTQRTAELQRTKEHVEAILDNSSDGIVVVRADGSISQINRACSAMFGYAPEELVGRAWKEFADSDQAIALEALVGSLPAGKQATRFEFEARRKDGTTFNVEIGMSQVGGLEFGASPAEFVCNVRDITLRKQVELELRRAFEQQKELVELKSAFVAMASHDFRTPPGQSRLKRIA